MIKQGREKLGYAFSCAVCGHTTRKLSVLLKLQQAPAWLPYVKLSPVQSGEEYMYSNTWGPLAGPHMGSRDMVAFTGTQAGKYEKDCTHGQIQINTHTQSVVCSLSLSLSLSLFLSLSSSHTTPSPFPPSCLQVTKQNTQYAPRGRRHCTWHLWSNCRRWERQGGRLRIAIRSFRSLQRRPPHSGPTSTG